jgi:uncharacterized membrane protein
LRSSILKREALQALKGNWGSVIGTTLLFLVISSFITPVSVPSMDENDTTLFIGSIGSDLLSIFSISLNLLIYGSLSLGWSSFFLHLCRSKKANIDLLFSYFTSWHRYIRGVVSYVLPFTYLLLWSLLFLIPGIIKSFSYAMTNYILIDHPELSVNQSITKSRKMMNGYKWKLFVLFLSFIGWFLLSLLTLGIGFIWLIPYLQTTITQFYLSLPREENI